MNRSLFVGVITLALATISARAAELAPMVGLEKNFRTGASALIYYTEGADGDHVVSASAVGIHSQWIKKSRFISILAPGQTAELSCRIGLWSTGPGNPCNPPRR